MSESREPDPLVVDPRLVDWLDVASHAVAFVTGPDRMVTWVSPSVTVVLGWEPDEVIGSGFVDFAHPDDIRATDAARDAVYSGTDPSPGAGWVMRMLTAEGDYRWMTSEIRVLTDEAGRPAGAAAMFRDVDELMVERERADQAELRLRSMFDALLNPHVLLTAERDEVGEIVDFVFAMANPRASEYLGVPHADLIGSRVLDRFPGQATTPMFARLVLVVETGRPLVMDRARVPRAVTDEPRYFDFRGVRVGDGLALTWREVTAEIDSEQALRRSEARYRMMSENACDVSLTGGPDGTIRWVSESVRDVLGWDPDDMVGRSPFEYLHPDDRQALIDRRVTALDETPTFVQARVATADGGWRWISSSSRAVRDTDGSIVEMVAAWHDIDELVRSRQAIADAAEVYRFVVENAPDVVFRTGVDGALRWVSPQATALAGREVEELIGHLAQEFVVPDDRDELDRSINDVLDGKLVTYRGRLVRPDGTTRWVSVSARPTRGDDGTVVGSVGTIRDIESLAEALALAEQERARAVATVETFLDPHVLLEAVRDDTGGIVDFVYAEANEAACTYNQLTRDQLVGTRVMDILPAHDASGLFAKYCEVVETGDPLVLDDYEYPHEILGEPRRFDIRGTKIGDAISFTWRDVTERHQRTARLAQRASHDPLTGLANRAAIVEELERAITAGERSGRLTAALLIDLDHFKNVNDSLGHPAGDRLLAAAARRIDDTVRGGDLVGRLGGDEFVAVMREIADPAEAVAVAGRIVTAFREPLEGGGLEFHTTTSVGIAVSGAATTADELLREADTALYRAKARGRDRSSLFNDDLRQIALDRLDLEAQLRPALANGELELWYQPEVDLHTGRLMALEALLRWRHPSGEIYPADRFVHIAEESGMMIEIGDWVIHQACRQAAELRHDSPERSVTVRINLSLLQLAEPGLTDTVDAALHATGVDPTSLCVEITESAFLHEASVVRGNLDAIRMRGIHIALDDFGTGYASLAYLRDFPIHLIKIDRSFTQRLLTNDYERHLVAGIISLAELLKMTVTAEGIEQPRQAEVLAELGCRAGQGYLYSPAVPPEEIEQFFDRAFGV